MYKVILHDNMYKQNCPPQGCHGVIKWLLLLDLKAIYSFVCPSV